jgi:glucose/arabinose dehydrogenase
MERRLPENDRGITAISFAPDGRMFLAFDADLAGEVDPLILYDAYHPSRTIAVYDWGNDMTPVPILDESSRVTGLDYADGALYVSRAGEVGRITDGGAYETLAGGFAVSSQLFHANNGIVVDNGWVYVSAGGVRDGYVEGPIVGVGEAGAQDIVSGGNAHAARIVRAPLDALLGQKTIGVFSTAGRGVRNPYGITADPAGRIWFTDNGATNVPDEIAAGDEVNVLDPSSIGGDEGSAPYYGFPLALSGETPEWYTDPALSLVNSAAPTGITYAYGTIYFGEYGRNPGVYRVAKAGDGTLVGERIMMAWPVLALAAAPDGALWVGMGDGGLYRLTPGCN